MQNRAVLPWLASVVLLCGSLAVQAAGYGGVPTYPGAKAVSHMKARDGRFQAVNLVSADPPARVRDWYRDHLPGWQFVRKFDAFFQSEDQVTAESVFTVPSVKVAADDGKAFDAVVSGVKGIRTRIQIVYRR